MREENIDFDPQRTPDLSFVSQIIESWTSLRTDKPMVLALHSDDVEVDLLSERKDKESKVIYIRLKDGRWEGCGYFHEPVAPESITQPSDAVSAISSVDIAPVTYTTILSETFIPKSMPSAVAERHRSSKPTTELLLEVSTSLWMLIDMLPCWMEVLDFSSNESLRSAPGIILSAATKLEKTLFGVLDVVRRNTTNAQKQLFGTKWKAYDKQRWMITQEEYEEVEQQGKEQESDKKPKQNKTRKQKQEAARQQKKLEEAKQKDCEQVKQREHHATIRMNTNNRWESFDYFQDSVSSASSLHASHKFSAISQIDIEPVIRTATPTAFSVFESTLIAATTDNGSLESTIKLFRAATGATIFCIRVLYCWIEVFYATNDHVCRPTVRHLVAAFGNLSKIVRSLEVRSAAGTTAEDKKAFRNKLGQYLKRERDEDIEQREHEAERRKAREAEQKEHEEAEQRVREEVKQREREEAETIAAAYAAQDRYDSCSDSD